MSLFIALINIVIAKDYSISLVKQWGQNLILLFISLPHILQTCFCKGICVGSCFDWIIGLCWVGVCGLEGCWGIWGEFSWTTWLFLFMLVINCVIIPRRNRVIVGIIHMVIDMKKAIIAINVGELDVKNACGYVKYRL